MKILIFVIKERLNKDKRKIINRPNRSNGSNNLYSIIPNNLLK